MSTYARGGDGMEPEVNDRLAAINGYGSSRDAERLSGRPLGSPDDADAADQADWEALTAYADDEYEEYDDDDGDAHGPVDEEIEDRDEDEDEDRDEELSADGQDEPPREWEGRLRAIDVHHAAFPRASFTRRGYDERSVDEFLSRVESEIVWLVEEKADLREEVARLRRQVRAAQDAPVPQMEEAQAQAVRLLAKAQQLADSYVAEAEAYSKRVSGEARQQYDETVAEARAAAGKVVEEARERAAELVSQAEDEARAAADRAAREAAAEAEQAAAERPMPGGSAADRAVEPVAVAPVDPELLERTQAEKQALEEQVAYLKTFSQVTRTQLRAYLEALLADVEAQWGRADPAAADRTRVDDTTGSGGLPRQPATETAGRRRRSREMVAPSSTG